jgi:hypothetical protein
LNKTIIESIISQISLIELILEKEMAIIPFKPKNLPKGNWENRLKKMHENGEDKLLMSGCI